MQYENSFPWHINPVDRKRNISKSVKENITILYEILGPRNIPIHEISRASLPNPAPGTKQVGGLIYTYLEKFEKKKKKKKKIQYAAH